MFRAGCQVSWYEWILPISSWHFTIRTFICTIFSTFSVIIQWQHVIWCHKWWYELLGPWPMCPPSFIEISWKMSEIWPLSNYYYYYLGHVTQMYGKFPIQVTICKLWKMKFGNHLTTDLLPILLQLHISASKVTVEIARWSHGILKHTWLPIQLQW